MRRRSTRVRYPLRPWPFRHASTVCKKFHSRETGTSHPNRISSPLLEPFTRISLLHEVELSSVNGNIRFHLQEKLAAMEKRRSDFDLADPWPCDGGLTTLTKKSSGLFVFVSTLAKSIESKRHEPNERLQHIVARSDRIVVDEGRACPGSWFVRSQNFGRFPHILSQAMSDVLHRCSCPPHFDRIADAAVSVRTSREERWWEEVSHHTKTVILQSRTR